MPTAFDPDCDLSITRHIPAPRARVWAAWTTPEELRRWWCPLPWTTPVVEMDLVPGGIFRTVMRGPDGEENGVAGCFLVVEPMTRIVFTDALGPGFRPAPAPFFSVEVSFADEGSGTRYTAHLMHATPEQRQDHENMGFQAGWGAVADQLSVLCSGLPAQP